MIWFKLFYGFLRISNITIYALLIIRVHTFEAVYSGDNIKKLVIPAPILCTDQTTFLRENWFKTFATFRGYIFNKILVFLRPSLRLKFFLYSRWAKFPNHRRLTMLVVESNHHRTNGRKMKTLLWHVCSSISNLRLSGCWWCRKQAVSASNRK
jgi:hypothetical protein